MITQNGAVVKQGMLFVSSYTRHRPLANAACLVAGAIVTSLAFHPTAKAGTPIAGEFPSVQLIDTPHGYTLSPQAVRFV